MSHKIAGPIYKLTLHLKSIQEGNPAEYITFRKGDHFLELAEDYNAAIKKIKDTYNQDFLYLQEIDSYINNLIIAVPEDKKSMLLEISNKINEIQNRFKTY